MTLALTGIGTSTGIGLGRVHRLVPGELEIPEYHLDPTDVQGEQKRFRQAVKQVERYLEDVHKRLDERTGQATAEFLEAHRLMLRDDMLFQATLDLVAAQRLNAEWALARQQETLLAEFERMDDEYLAARREDIDQVVHLIQRQLADQPVEQLAERIPNRLDETIIVAPSLTPADLAILHQRQVAGLITEHGSPWAHAAIVARSLDIPAIVGVHRASRLLRENEPVVLDGFYGVVLATDDDSLIGHYREKQAAGRRRYSELERYRDRRPKTADGEIFHLEANAELPAEIRRARDDGAGAVGLMRTEYLFMHPELPGEDEQYEAYRAAIEAMDGRPVTIRTLDAGADKLPPGLSMMLGPNPAMGLRGIRLSLSLPRLFTTQLRAILRASAHGPVRLLLPMITDLAEVRRARGLLAASRQALRDAGVDLDPEIPVGAMVEVPAAALAADALAREVDFLSIGTNDLTQYLLAIDRSDELVSHLYDPSHPAVVRTLAHILRAARRAGRPMSVCGELAGDPDFSRLLLGLGLRRFSMPPGRLLAVKQRLLESRADRCAELVDAFLVDDGVTTGASLMDKLAE